MRDVYLSLLTMLAAILGLWLILGFWPLSISSQAVLSLLVVLITCVTLWRQWRLSLSRHTVDRILHDDNLPPEDFQGAVILACGDSAALFSHDVPHRETRQGWYLKVNDPEQLLILAQHLSLLRPALIAQISVMLAILPEQHTSHEEFTSQLRGWQRGVTQCRRWLNGLPPVWTVTWISSAEVCAGSNATWFSVLNNRDAIQLYQPGHGNLSLTEWVSESDSAGRFSRLSQVLWIDSLLAWQHAAVNALLSVRYGELPVLIPCAQSMCLTAVSGVSGNLWQRHITTLTALTPPVISEAELCSHIYRVVTESAVGWCSGNARV